MYKFFLKKVSKSYKHYKHSNFALFFILRNVAVCIDCQLSAVLFLPPHNTTRIVTDSYTVGSLLCKHYELLKFLTALSQIFLQFGIFRELKHQLPSIEVSRKCPISISIRYGMENSHSRTRSSLNHSKMALRVLPAISKQCGTVCNISPVNESWRSKRL